MHNKRHANRRLSGTSTGCRHQHRPVLNLQGGVSFFTGWAEKMDGRFLETYRRRTPGCGLHTQSDASSLEEVKLHERRSQIFRREARDAGAFILPYCTSGWVGIDGRVLACRWPAYRAGTLPNRPKNFRAGLPGFQLEEHTTPCRSSPYETQHTPFSDIGSEGWTAGCIFRHFA